jgi:hypothetical protein
MMMMMMMRMKNASFPGLRGKQENLAFPPEGLQLYVKPKFF